ncbi:hypothetical protein BD309DRAFT_106324 [Dichomitus squalens]|nr:hypothetical protein BD309DRAFT_106324 [Dichomitus squalens]
MLSERIFSTIRIHGPANVPVGARFSLNGVRPHRPTSESESDGHRSCPGLSAPACLLKQSGAAPPTTISPSPAQPVQTAHRQTRRRLEAIERRLWRRALAGRISLWHTDLGSRSRVPITRGSQDGVFMFLSTTSSDDSNARVTNNEGWAAGATEGTLLHRAQGVERGRTLRQLRRLRE